MSRKPLILSHLKSKRLTTAEVLAVARGERPVALAPATAKLLQRRREQIVGHVQGTGGAHYGFNRGFGHNQKLPVVEEDLAQLQTNLIRSHAAGVGEPAPLEVVRAAMLLRAQSLTRGHSGVRPELVQRLLELLNADVVPLVPLYGSVGASGDLAPLSHMALPLIGEGQVFVGGSARPRQSAGVLRKLGLKPLALEMKEGLALNNGVQFSTAFGFLALDRVRTLLHNAALATSLAAQVMLGGDAPFRPDLHALRPHPGAVKVAGWVWALMQDSPMREFHRRYDVDGEVQDPYSLRCAAQILGACAELIDEAEATLLVEANAVTDNPVILPQGNQFTDVVSGGHFHGMPVATRLYGLVQALAIMARLSNMRSARYVDEERNKGMPGDLKWPGLSDRQKAISSTMMIPEYASAALTNWIWGAAMPSHLLSISTDAGQEDHVSMSAPLAVRLWQTLPRAAEVLAIELAFAAQAAAVRKAVPGIPTRIHREQSVNPEVYAADDPYLVRWSKADRKLSPAGEAVVARIARAFPPVKHDRVLGPQLQALAELVERGELVQVAARTLGRGQKKGEAPPFPTP